MNKVLSFVSLLALAYVVWLPVSNAVVLYSALALIAIAAAPRLLHLNSAVLVPGSILLATVLVMWVVGAIRGNELATSHALTLLPTIVVWCLWANAQSIKTIRWVIISIMISAAVLASGIVLMVGAELGWFPVILPDWFVEIQGGFTDVRADGTRIRFYGLSSLAAAVPLAIAGTVLPSSSRIAPRWLFGYVALVGTVATMIAGRRAIALVVVVAPLLTIIAAVVFARLSAATKLLGLVTAGATMLVGSTYLLSLDNALGRSFAQALSTFGGGGDSADQTRVTQSNELLLEFGHHPVFGAGAGASPTSGFIRSVERPWMFELQYHQLLMDGGILAVLLVLTSMAYVVLRSVAINYAEPLATPYFILAAVCGGAMLIANASNPYLIAPGHGWSVALVLAVMTTFSTPASLSVEGNSEELTKVVAGS